MTNEEYNEELLKLQNAGAELVRARLDAEAQRAVQENAERRRMLDEDCKHAQRIRAERLEEAKAHYRRVESLLAEVVAALKEHLSAGGSGK